MMMERSKAIRPTRVALARFLSVAAVGALALTMGSSQAAASVTIGQVAPSPTNNVLPGGIDFVPLNVASGNSYQVPGNGAITFWSHNAPSGPDQMIAMKVFRKFADPSFYRVVAHDGPRPMTIGLNGFQVNIPVEAGDVVGLFNASSGTAPLFTATPADTYGSKVTGVEGGLKDGESAGFNMGTNARVNVSAVFVPSNAVTLGKTTLNKKKGAARFNLTLPNPGELAASGNGVKASSNGQAAISKSVAAGPAQLLIKAKGKKRKTLNETGKVKLNVGITYTPTGGDPSSQSVKVKLRKK